MALRLANFSILYFVTTSVVQIELSMTIIPSFHLCLIIGIPMCTGSTCTSLHIPLPMVYSTVKPLNKGHLHYKDNFAGAMVFVIEGVPLYSFLYIVL